MNKFMIFPCKQVVKLKISSQNRNKIKDKIYLLSGKACYYYDDPK